MPASPVGGVSISHRNRMQYDHVYYDVNNSIYSLISRSNSEEHFFIRLYHDIDLVLKRLNGDRLQSLFLAVDGPGPRAKVSTQLSRRLKVDYDPNDQMQRLGFTPGTRFMERLRAALNVYAATRATVARNPNFAVWVSGSDCPGEGENKCFNHMRLVPPSHQCLVIGNDSDLIPYALQAHCEVHILREKAGQIINTKTLKHDLAHGVLNEHMPRAEAEQRIADDFVFLAILIGNDYIPGARGFYFDQTWEAYRMIKRTSPAARSKYIFDAANKVVNWKFLHDVTGRGAGGPATEEQQQQQQQQQAPEMIRTFARLHPKSVVNELMMFCGDTPLFDDGGRVGTTTTSKVVKMSSSSKTWELTGVGKSRREALVDVAVRALAPDSPLLAQVAALPEPQLRKAAILLENLSSNFDEVRKWLAERGCNVPEDAKLGSLPGYEFATKKAPSIVKDVRRDELMRLYFEGIVWSFQYYGGEVKNYGYCYPFRETARLQDLCQFAPQLSGNWDSTTAAVPPLSPLVLGLCLLAGPRRALLPSPVGEFVCENDPTVGHIFENDCELLTLNPEQLSTSLDEVETWVTKMDKTTWSSEAKHLLGLHRPTAFMKRHNPLLRAAEDLKAFQYAPPKLPEGVYKRLVNAPNSEHMVAAVNHSAPTKHGWFHFDTPYMQKRHYSSSGTVAIMGAAGRARFSSLARFVFRK